MKPFQITFQELTSLSRHTTLSLKIRAKLPHTCCLHVQGMVVSAHLARTGLPSHLFQGSPLVLSPRGTSTRGQTVLMKTIRASAIQ